VSTSAGDTVTLLLASDVMLMRGMDESAKTKMVPFVSSTSEQSSRPALSRTTRV